MRTVGIMAAGAGNKAFLILGERLRAYHDLAMGRFFKEPEVILEEAERRAVETSKIKVDA